MYIISGKQRYKTRTKRKNIHDRTGADSQLYGLVEENEGKRKSFTHALSSEEVVEFLQKGSLEKTTAISIDAFSSYLGKVHFTWLKWTVSSTVHLVVLKFRRWSAM